MSESEFDFDRDVIERSHTLPVLVDFWAEWCGPCKSLGPVLEKMATEAVDNWQLVKIDVDAHQDIAGRFQVRSVPSVMLFVAGEKIAEFTGALPESEVQVWLSANLPTPADRQLLIIERLLAAGEFATATSQLEALVAEDPALLKARIYLAHRRMFSEPAAAVAEVADARLGDGLFERVEEVRFIGNLLQRDEDSFAESPVREAYLQALTALREGQIETALEGFIKTLVLDPSYDDEGARRCCIAILNWWGEADDRVRGYRQKIQRALH